MKRYALLVAGGSGSRMKSATPKQFIPLAGKPLLVHTLERFYHHDASTTIIVVLPSFEQVTWEEIKKKYEVKIPHTLAEGGTTRFHSVMNGLKHVPDGCIVAIHDGVRPNISTALIERCFREAELHGNAIPVVPVNDSVRRVQGDRNIVVDRTQYVLVQTPQCFHSTTLKRAYEKDHHPAFTDDASVFEKSGHEIRLVDGERWNLKITHPEDLAVMEMLLKGRH